MSAETGVVDGADAAGVADVPKGPLGAAPDEAPIPRGPLAGCARSAPTHC